MKDCSSGLRLLRRDMLCIVVLLHIAFMKCSVKCELAIGALEFIESSGTIGVGRQKVSAARRTVGYAQSTAPASEIRITAKKYDFTPNAITVRKGDRVRLVITALDRNHGIKIEAFRLDQKLPKD